MVMMIDLTSQSRFFVGAVVGLAIDRTVGLAIGRAVLIKTNVTIGFFGLFLW